MRPECNDGLNGVPAHTWETLRVHGRRGLCEARMPDSLRRYHHSRQSNFVTFTCYHRLPQLNTGELHDVVVEALEGARTGYRVRVYVS